MLPPQLATSLDASVLLESSGSTRELKHLMSAPLAGLDTTVKVCLAPTPRKNVKQVSCVRPELRLTPWLEMVWLSLFLLREVMPIRSPLNLGSVKSGTTVRKLELSHA
jgi:hypothetical protein